MFNKHYNKFEVKYNELQCTSFDAEKIADTGNLSDFENFNPADSNFGKVIIMTDADVDGSHIRVLLLTLFYRFFKPIVEAGHVYAAQPPLYRITHGKTRKYVLDEAERDEYLAGLGPNTKYDIMRMK